MEDETENVPLDAPMLSASEETDNEVVETENQELVDSEAGEAEETGEEEQEQEEVEDEFDEVEIEGKKYSIPKALKPNFMMQADYTRKTQETAETRKELEAREEAFKQQSEAQRQNIADYAKVAAIEEAIAQYQQVDWAKYEQDDPLAAQSHWRRYTDLKEQRREAAERLSRAEHERSQKAQQDYAKRVEDTARIVTRDIKDWSPALANKLTEFALQQGYTQQEIVSGLNTDARAIKVLHKAYLADQVLKQQKKQKPSDKTQPAIKPLKQVSTRASRPAATAAPSDKDSDDVWLAKREAELRKRQRA